MTKCKYFYKNVIYRANVPYGTFKNVQNSLDKLGKTKEKVVFWGISFMNNVMIIFKKSKIIKDLVA